MTATSTLSAVERHPQYPEMLKAWAAGKSDAEIISWLTPSLDRTTLWRYRKKRRDRALERIAQPLATVAMATQHAIGRRKEAQVHQAVEEIQDATRALLAMDPILARIARDQETIDRSVTVAAAKEDSRGVAALISTDLKGIELHARLTGRLEQAAGPTTQIMIVAPGAQVSVGAAAQGEQIADNPKHTIEIDLTKR